MALISPATANAFTAIHGAPLKSAFLTQRPLPYRSQTRTRDCIGKGCCTAVTRKPIDTQRIDEEINILEKSLLDRISGQRRVAYSNIIDEVQDGRITLQDFVSHDLKYRLREKSLAFEGSLRLIFDCCIEEKS